jgi:hypothetical protein
MLRTSSIMKLTSWLCLVLIAHAMTYAVAATSPKATNHGQPAQETTAPLSNKDVIELVKAGLSADIVATKIKTSKSNFDTSVTALQELKAAGVPDSVILEMVQGQTKDAVSQPAPTANETASSAPATGESKALIYVYRKKNFNTRNMQPSVYVDGEEVARMDDGKFFVVKLNPGKHNLEVNKGHSGAQIDMKAGEQYYFRVDIKAGFLKGRSEVTYMQKEQGALEIQKMNPLEDKWIKDKSKVAVDGQNSKN